MGSTTSASGILVIDKPAGMTSHGVVAQARRLLGTRKIGHAGTLDPMATGVLILGVNRGTRLLGHLALHDKAYEATIRLGESTLTDDAEGEILSSVDTSGLSAADVKAAMGTYVGQIAQVPSAVSAIKVDGKRAYARVRRGEEIQLAPRQVNIELFDLREVRREGAFLDCDVVVECSSGTYVRALARDLGADLGVGGHLTVLRRTRIGAYSLKMAVSLGESNEVPPMLSLAEAARLSFPVVEVDAGAAVDIGYGRPLAINVESNPTGIIGPSGDLLALYRPADSGFARPLAVLM